MRAIFGLLQLALGVGGIVALFNGQFLLMIAAWVGALLIGWVGNRMVRGVMGVSQSGQEAFSTIPAILGSIESGRYSAAESQALGAVRAFRMGGDRALLPMALMLQGVALGANGKFEEARRAINEADSIFLSAPAKIRELNDEIRPAMIHVRDELRKAHPDSDYLVSRFHELLE